MRDCENCGAQAHLNARGECTACGFNPKRDADEKHAALMGELAAILDQLKRLAASRPKNETRAR